MNSMTLNPVAIIVATVVQFVVGFLWYGPLFGSLWGRMHGFDKLSKDVQQKMMKEMGPYYGAQFAVTILTSVVMSLFDKSLGSEWHLYGLGGFMWLGFTLPANVSSVIFGGTERKWIVTKIAVMGGGSLACIMAAAFALSLFQ